MIRVTSGSNWKLRARGPSCPFCMHPTGFEVWGLGFGRTFVGQCQPSRLLPAQSVRTRLPSTVASISVEVVDGGMQFIQVLRNCL